MNYKKLLNVFLAVVPVTLFFLWQNNAIIVNEYEYMTKEISSRFDGFRIVQISDLHNKEFGKKQRYLLNIIRNAAPDMIVLTGDQVDSRKTNIKITMDFIQEALKIAPVYFVSGNHELRLAQKAWNDLMGGFMQLGAIPMDNRVMEITKDGELGFYLIGLSDHHLTDDTLKNISSSLPSNSLKIVLAHEPQYMENYRYGGADLVLSGHVHGGQFRIPGVGGLLAPNHGFFPKYSAGPYQEGNTTMIVSRGLGNSVIPIRIFNRPQIIIVKLVKK